MDITPEQRESLNPLFDSLEEGGGILAQIYPDGIRARIINADEAVAIAKITGAKGGRFAYAREAHEFCVEDEK